LYCIEGLITNEYTFSGHHFVAFSATLRGSLTASQNNQKVIFGKVITNYGNGYKDGVFTSPTNGLYVFDWTILTIKGRIGGTYLAVNGKFVKYDGWAQGGSTYASASTSAVLELKKGDKVWIYTSKGYFIHDGHSSFQGWLLRDL